MLKFKFVTQLNQMAHPIQIISTNSSANDDPSETESKQEFRLEKENLRSIIDKIPKDSKIAIVSVVGAFRTGKSFLLTLLLRYLKHGKSGDMSHDWMYCDGDSLTEGNCNKKTSQASNAGLASPEKQTNPPNPKRDDEAASFAWRGGHDRMTTGIWMWSEPFLYSPPNLGEQIAVLLMDTQGMFDNETTMTLTAQIFGISTLISSTQIYNIQNRISEDHLQHLALFSEYGRIAHQRNDADTEVSDDTNSWFSSSAPKPFQRLQFLIRDWANFEESFPGDDGDGASTEEKNARHSWYLKLRAEMQSYLTKLIKTRGDADLQSTRDQIARCFERVDCFMLPHPGLPATKPNYDGSLKLLDASFCELVDRFARLIFDEQLEPKRVQKRHITGIELANYFEVYTSLFQSGEGFPKAMTILDATAEANNRNAYELAVNRYIEKMGSMSGKGASEVFMKEAELKVRIACLERNNISFTHLPRSSSLGQT